MGALPSVGGRVEPLSSNQLRMWLYCQALPRTPTFHGPVVARLEGPLQIDALRAAVDRLASRHEILRTRFPMDGHIPVQLIEERGSVPLSLVDLTHLSASMQDTELTDLMESVTAQGFDYASGPAWRVVLVRLAGASHVLAVTAHHMIVDLWSIGLILDELCGLYRTSAAGRPPDLPQVPLQQSALAARQRDHLPRQHTITRQQWWRDHLGGIRAVRLAPDRPAPTAPRLTTDVFQTELDAPLSEEVRALGRELGTSVYTTALAALTVLVAGWFGQTEFAVVSNTSGRIGRDAERVVGTPVEYLIVRLDAGGDPAFRELVARIGEATLAAFDHLLPLDDMLEAIDPGRTSWPSPLRQLGFAVLNTPRATPALPGIALSPFAPTAPFTENGICEGELWVELFETGSGPLGIRWQFGTGLFKPSAAEHAVRALTDLLADAVKRPDARLSELAVAAKPEPVPAAVPAPSTPDDAVIESVRAAVAEVLGVPAARGTDNFFLLGGGTQDAVALAGILSARWGVELGALEVELAPTVDGIARAVARLRTKYPKNQGVSA